ncbi:transposase, mutator type [Artemisia annua]|uniref:Transposase, mutator type n=1 Tax=Artemisia annua TaxID=35608 RepID=A0A2U1NNE4_ARTAN|nr:transposase, mutator type [Artemisia annua]
MEIEFFVEHWITTVDEDDLDDDGVENIGFDVNVKDTHGQSSSKNVEAENVDAENDKEVNMEDIVDEEHIIDELEVNMDDFRYNGDKETYVDPSGRPHFEVTDEALEDKSVCPWKVYISPGRNGKWVVKTLNNEHKCLKSREIKACTSTFLAKHVVNLISHNPEIPTVAIQEQMQSKFQEGHIVIYRSTIYVRHAVACIFNMADNGMQVPIPEDWVHDSYRLETWRKVYSHKVNPVPGPHFWGKSPFNQTKLIPPYIPPQIGRPEKKIKKSVGEVNEMVKGGKLTRKGGTVTCDNYGVQGHKKRSCKVPNPWKDPSYNAPQSSVTTEKAPSGHQTASASKAQRQPSKTPMKTTITGKQASASKAPRRSPRKKSASQSKTTASQSKSTAVPKKGKKTASRNIN